MIGGDEVNASLRDQLLADQIRATLQLTPAFAIASLPISLLLMVMVWATPLFSYMAVWTGLVCLTLVFGLHSRLSFENTRHAALRTVLYAFVTGCLWGSLPSIVLMLDDPAIKLAASVSIVGVLCVTVLSMAVMPIAAIAFALPVIAGILASIVFMATAAEANVVLVLVVAFIATVPFIGLGIARNFVRHRLSEQRMRHQKDVISLLLKEFGEHSSDWLWEIDRDGRMQRVSARFIGATGQAPEKLEGRGFIEFLMSCSIDNRLVVREIEQAIQARVTFHDVVLKLEHEVGERWWRLSGKPVADEAGVFSGYIGTASDITAERLAQRQINFLAHNDALTGLANRGSFTEHLKQNVARLERYGTPFAVLYLDLDQFKAVNDGFGHMAGDKLLGQVSQRIQALIRESDVAARLGGDEFAIILTSQCAAEAIAEIADRLVNALSQPYEFDEGIVSIGVSIGVAVAPANGTRPDQILRNADLALYRAKGDGKGVYRFFESHMDSDVRERRLLELELREALKEKEFVLYYQPLVEADGKKASGFEALIRWDHPIRGVVPPAEFIPIAEQTGLIKYIGDWTIHEACRAATRWPEELFVAVNLSARHFLLSDIVEVVRSALTQSKLSPHRLELEITESLLMENADEVIEKLTELKALGVTVAMDDFGTGYSSLSYLLKFPFDKIKIDKSFVTASSEDVVARDILRSIATLGKTLKMRITAEGVETKEQVEFLQEIACHQLQGFYFSHPLNEADLACYFLNQFERESGGARKVPRVA